MRVEIISGNETGTVKDLPQIEAEIAIQTGFAKACEEEPQAESELTADEDEESQTKSTRQSAKSKKK